RCTERDTHRRRKSFNKPDERLFCKEPDDRPVYEKEVNKQCQKHTDKVHAELLDCSETGLCKCCGYKAECTDCCKIFHDCKDNPHDHFVRFLKQFNESRYFIFYCNHRDSYKDCK